LLAFEQTLRAVFRVAEGEARTSHHIDPGLERGRYAEVVDRRPDHHDVRRLQFGDQRVGLRERGALLRGALVGRREIRVDPGLVDERQAPVQHAPGQLDAAVALLERTHQVGAQHAAHRAVAPAARGDLQYLERCLCFRVLHLCVSSVLARCGFFTLKSSLTIDREKINRTIRTTLFFQRQQYASIQ
jgi:hypothetical protein